MQDEYKFGITSAVLAAIVVCFFIFHATSCQTNRDQLQNELNQNCMKNPKCSIDSMGHVTYIGPMAGETKER